MKQTEILLSLPPVMAREMPRLEPRWTHAFAACDPAGTQVGSGGGTAHMLAEAWRARGRGRSFDEWLDNSLKIVVHSGGESRRLPAYAATGKAFIPVPVFRWSRGQRLDQTLLDLQWPFLARTAAAAPASSRLMVVSGDVLLECDGEFPAMPEADVVMLGMWAAPEDASHFGVFFCHRDDPSRLVTVRQKPSPAEIRSLSERNLFLLDIGVWLFSHRAASVLMKRGGWDPTSQDFAGGRPAFHDLYSEWAPLLGEEPQRPDDEIGKLRAAVAVVPEGRFHHFGRSRDLIESVYRLQNLVLDQTRYGDIGVKPHPKIFVQNVLRDRPMPTTPQHTMWLENSAVPAGWSFAHDHVMTGAPDNRWTLAPEPGVCLDFVPVGETDWCIRPYGMDDAFRGPVGDPATRWMGRPAPGWFAARGLEMPCPADTDLQRAPLFPVLAGDALADDFIRWMTAERPEEHTGWTDLWRRSRRLSAADLLSEANLVRLYDQRQERRNAVLPALARNFRQSVFYRLDLRHAADLYARTGHDVPDPVPADPGIDPLTIVHDAMFRAEVLRRRDRSEEALPCEREAFAALSRSIVEPLRRHPVRPHGTVLDDQIVWGRSPVRLDIAGGWTDTPPYCLEHGGAVMNLGVDLNGQPPIQVFVRRRETPEIVVRSIDTGAEDRLTAFEEIGRHNGIGTGFAIARAALALAGFHPDFCAERFASLAAQLGAMGGGLEISMMAAVPKGSGLGTSSILAATLLGVLSDVCGFGWDRLEITRRTLALEQLLTSGGGWQDQAGGLWPGVKCIETAPGLAQRPVVRWLPPALFEQPETKSQMLLYYTGITRVAHHILGEIVRGFFLNSRREMEILGDIRQAAEQAVEAVQRQDLAAFADVVAKSWELNQRLDDGTNVPGVQAILDTCGADLAGAKLLGAGGGGYLFMIANDADAANRIRRKLHRIPPNEKARFVDFGVSTTGLQVTRS